jgi:3-hydroxyacyl-[acyl-carrier-protein] dehydratase
MSSLFQHNFPNVEDYLHHRAPYLLVSAIERLESEAIETSTLITGDEFFMGGHFPGASIVPGAMMQEMTTQTAGILIAARFNPMQEFNTHDPFFNEYALGVLMRVRGARFRGIARPGDTLQTHVELVDQLGDVFEFKARMTLNDKLVMSNSFQLANIPSATLQGEQEPVNPVVTSETASGEATLPQRT